MKLTIQEKLLRGATPRERFLRARDLGMDGVEVRAISLVGSDEALFDYAAAVDASGVPVSGLLMDDAVGLLSMNTALRDFQIDRVRQALTDAHDLRIPHVTVIPQPAHAPVETTPEQEYALMIWFVRVVNDLAGAMNTRLLLLPLEPSQARVLNTLQQTYAALEEMRFHPWVGMSADLYSLHNSDSLEKGSGIMPMLHQIYLHEPSDRSFEPSEALKTLISYLSGQGFTGQWTISAGLPVYQEDVTTHIEGLERWLGHLRGLGYWA